MRIAVLSDTHSSAIWDLPPGLLKVLAQVDMMVHLGDFTSEGLLADLQEMGRFEGVCGNRDVAGVRELLPSERVLQVQGKRVALIHGWGSPAGIEDRVRDRFRGVDVILYGHTHQAASLWLKGVLMLNPGSATGTFPATCKSYGILTISDTVSADIVRLEENVTSPVGHSADGVASYTTPR